MIQIKPHDTIIDILKKISTSSEEKIILAFPFGHPVLHNYLSLKVIKAKTEHKSLQILSNDQTSRKIGKKLGIHYGKNKSEALKKSSQNYALLHENYSFFEYALFEFKRYWSIINGNLKQNRKLNSLYYQNQNSSIGDKKILIILLLICISILFMLMYIYYFAINKTIVTITPEIIIQNKARNFRYVESTGSLNSNNPFIIPIEKISQNIEIKSQVTASGIKQESLHMASGEVIFTNLFVEKVSLRKNTIFETKDGIQFFTKKDITIPAATKDSSNSSINAGTKIGMLYGKIQLQNGGYSGEKANINAGELLIAEKLGEDKTKIFAKSNKKFTGGTNDRIAYIKEEDIIEGKKSLEETLKQQSITSIQKKIAILNQNNNIKKVILPVDNIYKYSDIKVYLPEHIIDGFEQDSFEIKGSLTISTYIYNIDSVISVLSSTINETALNDLEKIHSINEDSLRVSHTITRNDLFQGNNGKYFYKNLGEEDTFTLKATSEIEYYSSKRFTEVSNNFLQKSRYQISDIDIKEAEKILLNSPDINNVSISVTPFFLNHTSKLPNNIIFKINNSK